MDFKEATAEITSYQSAVSATPRPELTVPTEALKLVRWFFEVCIQHPFEGSVNTKEVLRHFATLEEAGKQAESALSEFDKEAKILADCIPPIAAFLETHGELYGVKFTEWKKLTDGMAEAKERMDAESRA